VMLDEQKAERPSSGENFVPQRKALRRRARVKDPRVRPPGPGPSGPPPANGKRSAGRVEPAAEVPSSAPDGPAVRCSGPGFWPRRAISSRQELPGRGAVDLGPRIRSLSKPASRLKPPGRSPGAVGPSLAPPLFFPLVSGPYCRRGGITFRVPSCRHEWRHIRPVTLLPTGWRTATDGARPALPARPPQWAARPGPDPDEDRKGFRSSQPSSGACAATLPPASRLNQPWAGQVVLGPLMG